MRRPRRDAWYAAVPDLRVSLAGWDEVASLRGECGLMPQPAAEPHNIIDEAPLLHAIDGLKP